MKYKVLIAEDDNVIREVLKEHLENEGYEVFTAVNGQEAVDLAKKEKPHIIVMDMFMPVMDGWDATHAIKFDKELGHIKVIGLSAYTSAGHTKKSLESYCDLLLIKPIYPDVLKKHIAELLKMEEKEQNI